MSPETEVLVRQITRAVAVGCLVGGGVLLCMELGGVGVGAVPSDGIRPAMLTLSAALILGGPLFWLLAKAQLAVLGASAGLLLGVALATMGLFRDGEDTGFDMGLGLCLAAVALWSLWGLKRGR